MRKFVVCAAWVAFVATVVVANWLVKHYGPVRVWPTALVAPAGVYAAGLAFLLRDTVQRLAGPAFGERRRVDRSSRVGTVAALSAVAVGTVLSVIVATPDLALASSVAFAASELIGLTLFWLLGGVVGGRGRVTVALCVSSLVGAAIDSYLFLTIAFHSTAYFDGQFVAKVSVTVAALPIVLLARRRTA